MITENGKSITLKRAFNVDVATLYNAWKDPAIFKAWWKDLSVAEMDFRIGGNYELRWKQDPEGSTTGTYLEIVPNKKIVMSWTTIRCGEKEGEAQNSQITLRFTSKGSKSSHFELVHTLLPSESCIDDHHLGWTCALTDLDKFLNSENRPVIQGLEARVSRIIPFPVEKVFEAWTNPKTVALWFNGRQATQGKAGGSVKVGSNLFMDYQTVKGDVCRVYCEYKEIIPNQKLSFLWASESCEKDYCIDQQFESRVIVLFTATGDSTKVEVIHDQITSEISMKDYLEGWKDCLASIEDRLNRLDRNIANLKFSPYIDIKVSNPEKAAELYTKCLGWVRVASKDHEYAFKFGPLNLFLSKSQAEIPKSNVHFELSTTDNIEAVKKTLEAQGCTSCSSSMRNSYMFTDPFGNNFHIYQSDGGKV